MSKQRTKPAPASAPVESPEAPAALTPEPLVAELPAAELVEEQPAVEPAEAAPVEGEPAPASAPVAMLAPGPTWQDLKAAAELGALVEVRLLKGSEPQLRGGLVLYREARRYALSIVAEAGESHLRALADDLDIEARVVFPEPG